MLTFLIETDVPDPSGITRLMYAAKEMGHRVILIKRDDLILQCLVGQVGAPLVFFGSLNTIRDLQDLDRMPPPLVWCDWESLSCHTYYAKYGKYLIQEEYGFYPFAEIPRIKDFLYKTYGFKNKIFMRPDTGDKSFTGTVIGEPEFEYQYKIAQARSKNTDLCVVSKPTLIHSEYRFVIANRKVVAGSLYRIGGMLLPNKEYPEEAAALAEEIATVWSPHPIFVIDIAKLRNGEYRLMEIGMINGAGLYCCDARSIIGATAEIATRECFHVHWPYVTRDEITLEFKDGEKQNQKTLD